MKPPRKYQIGARYVTKGGRVGIVCGHILNVKQTHVIGIQVRLRPGAAGVEEIQLARREHWSVV